MTARIGMDGYFTGADYPGQLVPQMTPAHIVAAAGTAPTSLAVHRLILKAWKMVRQPEQALLDPFRELQPVSRMQLTQFLLAHRLGPLGLQPFGIPAMSPFDGFRQSLFETVHATLELPRRVNGC